jgi:two-component system, NarL family, response regulator NreC
MRPKVLLADDHAVIAEGLARLIGDVADLVGQVNDGVRLVEEVRRLRPDIVVADITMPGMSGIDAMRQLKAEGSEARFIFLTIHTEARLAAEAMRSGASAYLLKQAAGNELFDAIKAVMSGRTYLTPLITGEVLRKLSSPTDAAERELTPRQREVLRLLAQGKRMKEIAADLNISVRTVENHKAQLLQVLSLGSTADLVRFAIKQHIVPE